MRLSLLRGFLLRPLSLQFFASLYLRQGHLCRQCAQTRVPLTAAWYSVVWTRHAGPALTLLMNVFNASHLLVTNKAAQIALEHPLCCWHVYFCAVISQSERCWLMCVVKV